MTPLVILQLVSAAIFYENHWTKVSRGMARGLAGDISTLIELLRQDSSPQGIAAITELAAQNMGLLITLNKDEILKQVSNEQTGGMTDRIFIRVLAEAVRMPFHVDSTSIEKDVVVNIQLPTGIFRIIVNRKRLFSSTTYIFVLWMVGTSMILFGLATIFMRNQVKPIRRLAKAADEFGKGRDTPGFKPEGAKEVRLASSAFISMRDRIERQMAQRTDMLSGVSHDLRTPLTRMKLQLEMVDEGSDVLALKNDIVEMEHMLEGYLAFARGEGDEIPKLANLKSLIDDIVNLASRTGGKISFVSKDNIAVKVRLNAFKRCITNLVANSQRYGNSVVINLRKVADTIEITVEDDGPGIPEHKRDEVFKPFFRLDDSRNRDTGGIGLGLTIARDIIRGHGGDITLGVSTLGGLKVVLVFPI